MGRLSRALGTAYTVDSEIGRGGMGVVYNAKDERLKRRVAIKVLPPELAFREEIRLRFLREAETAARLSHPHIVPIFSVGEGPDGLVYFIMAFVDGEPLSGKLQRRGTLPPEEVRRILLETVDALGAAHALGIVHRDVKPDNILLEGSRGRVMVTDFGIAKALSSATGGGTLTGTGVAIGTPHYMSPEQALGEREIDGRSDLYSLGVVGYQMLVGELPFSAPTVPGLLMKQITEEPPDITLKRADCPAELAACVMRCLDKDPEKRWPTADALRRALESRSTPAWRPSARPQTRMTGSGLGSRPSPGRAALPVPRSPDVSRGRPPRRQRERDNLPQKNPGGEAAMVRSTRSAFVTWASASSGMMLLNLVTSHDLSWSLVVAGIWGAFGVLPRFFKLWEAGYSWRDVFMRPAAPDAAEARLSPAGSRAPLLPASTDDFGRDAATIDQVRRDRQAIFGVVERLSASDRERLPDVVATVDALMARAENLARMLFAMSGDVDGTSLPRIDERIATVQKQPEGPERDRQLGLLERQRQALTDLVGRRDTVRDQLESCVLAMQNVRYDLLRLKSAGIGAVLGDLTQATQQARALSRDVDHAIAAAGEVKDLMRS
ncbi:MAG TPA: protein kinase [Gemmatimonadales bacterium]|nr:protein kinase [Gemmatimonadales bacterium]